MPVALRASMTSSAGFRCCSASAARSATSGRTSWTRPRRPSAAPPASVIGASAGRGRCRGQLAGLTLRVDRGVSDVGLRVRPGVRRELEPDAVGVPEVERPDENTRVHLAAATELAVVVVDEVHLEAQLLE